MARASQQSYLASYDHLTIADPGYAQMLDLLRALSPAERFARALALSALVRDLAWEGAVQSAGHLGSDAVTERFLVKLYGREVASRVVLALKTPRS